MLILVLLVVLSSGPPKPTAASVAPQATLVIHGDADRIVPFEASGARTAKLIKGAELVVIKDGPHNFAWTHAEETNGHLVRFFR